MNEPAPWVGALVLRVLPPAEVAAAKSARQLFALTEEFGYATRQGFRISVPAGFVTDFASIPRGALWYIDDDDPAILQPSVIHDLLYSCGGSLPDRKLTRQECDAILREAMLASGATPAQAWIVYQAVRLGGSSHWPR